MDTEIVRGAVEVGPGLLLPYIVAAQADAGQPHDRFRGSRTDATGQVEAVGNLDRDKMGLVLVESTSKEPQIAR
jgi:hypothetical protein